MEVDVLPAVEENDEQPAQKQTFIPGRHVLQKDEILEPDDSVYEMRHTMNVNWPCLSFDVLKDSLGDERRKYPATAYIVAGTQADVAKNNELSVYKMSSLHRTQKDAGVLYPLFSSMNICLMTLVPVSFGFSDNSDSDSDDDDDGDNLDEDAVLEYRSVPHMGGVNRVRAQPFGSSPLPPDSQPYHVATWAETGKVHIWDVRPLIESLDTPGYVPDKKRTNSPVFTVSAHGRAEGFAMDWASSGGDASNNSSLRLLTGDIHSKIYLTTAAQSGFMTMSSPFTSHTSSVEDIQWSPAEATVFASCSADRSIQIWDVRVKSRKSALSIMPAHDSDVNVISWNRGTTYLLLSGGDDGSIRTWDLRNVKEYVTELPLSKTHILTTALVPRPHLALLRPLLGTKLPSLRSSGIRQKTRPSRQPELTTKLRCGTSPSNKMMMKAVLLWMMAPQMEYHLSYYSCIKARRTSRKCTGIRRFRVR
jgi:ribosome assembly protein RRB1